VYITPLKVYHSDILLIHKPYDMSLLLFHQGNVPIIEDDMKFAEIKLENHKTTGKNWAFIGFVTPEDVLCQIVMDLIYGRIDGIKLVMDLTAFRSPSNPEGAITTGFPYFTVDYDNQKLDIQVAGSGIIMPTDDQIYKIDYIIIYADGDLDIGLMENKRS
jgi:hypothetical protein